MTHITKQLEDVGSQLAVINGTFLELEVSYNQLVEEHARLKLELDSMAMSRERWDHNNSLPSSHHSQSNFSTHSSFVNPDAPEQNDEPSVPDQPMAHHDSSTLDTNEPRQKETCQDNAAHTGEQSETETHNTNENGQSNHVQSKNHRAVQGMAEKRMKTWLNKEKKIARLAKGREQNKHELSSIETAGISSL
jgi:hypothetical protein